MLEILLIIFLFALFIHERLKVKDLRKKVESLEKGVSVKFGKTMEQLMPFTKKFPFPPESFRFLGSPIDGLFFGDDEIVFVEFKTGKSQLSEKEKKIKKLVENKKVRWLEIRV